MDIIEELVAEHTNLRKHLRELRVGLRSGKEMAGIVRSFIEMLDQHEDKEDMLLEAGLAKKESQGWVEQTLRNYDHMHQSIHPLLEGLRVVGNSMQAVPVAQTVAALCTLVESHLTYEEEVIFPLLKDLIPASERGELSEKCNSVKN